MMRTIVQAGVLALAILAALLAGTYSSKGSPQLANAQEAFHQQTITLKGQVVNRTEGATLQPGLQVTLHSFSQSSGAFITQDAATDDSGSFVFRDVELMQEGGYAVTMDYADAPYRTLVRPEDLGKRLELVVYETTQDISVIRVVSQALILTGVDPREQMITAAILVNLSNESDRTLLPDLTNVGPGRFSFLRFSLPPQAEELDVQSDLMGGQIIPMGSGFAMTAPVTPGEHSISFSFRFPYQGNALSYKQSLLQGADVFRVLIPQQLSEIGVATMEPVPPPSAAGVSYLVWESTDLAPGQGVEVELANLPRANPLSRWGRVAIQAAFWQVALPVALGAVLAGLLIYGGVLGIRRADGGDGRARGRGLSELPPTSRAKLIDEIAVLDNGFQQGEIDSAAFTSRRAELKALLLNLGVDQSSSETEATSTETATGVPDP